MVNDTKNLLIENIGRLVTLIKGRDFKGALVLESRIGGESNESDSIHGFKAITREGDSYQTYYFGLGNCEAEMMDGRVVIRLNTRIGCDGSYGGKPDYDCPLKREIEMLEMALAGGTSA